MSTTPGLTSTPRAGAATITVASGTASAATEVPGIAVPTDGNAGTVPGDDTGVYKPVGIAAPKPMPVEDRTGFYFHDMLHREAGGLPIIPRSHYDCGSGGYQLTTHSCFETSAQLLRDMQSSAKPHETARQVFQALPTALKLPLAETFEGTRQFIKDHPFFHEGLMDLPIGFGKHFRNVPFIGPGRIIFGLVTLNRTEIAKGVETTRGTWAAE